MKSEPSIPSSLAAPPLKWSDPPHGLVTVVGGGGIEGSHLRAEFYRLWTAIRQKLPDDWRKHPAAEQAAWLTFFDLKTHRDG